MWRNMNEECAVWLSVAFCFRLPTVLLFDNTQQRSDFFSSTHCHRFDSFYVSNVVFFSTSSPHLHHILITNGFVKWMQTISPTKLCCALKRWRKLSVMRCSSPKHLMKIEHANVHAIHYTTECGEWIRPETIEKVRRRMCMIHKENEGESDGCHVKLSRWKRQRTQFGHHNSIISSLCLVFLFTAHTLSLPAWFVPFI